MLNLKWKRCEITRSWYQFNVTHNIVYQRDPGFPATKRFTHIFKNTINTFDMVCVPASKQCKLKRETKSLLKKKSGVYLASCSGECTAVFVSQTRKAIGTRAEDYLKYTGNSPLPASRFICSICFFTPPTNRCSGYFYDKNLLSSSWYLSSNLDERFFFCYIQKMGFSK